MSLLFDIYLEQSKRGPSRNMDAEFYQKISFLERVKRTRPEHAEKAAELLEKWSGLGKETVEAQREIWQYQREAEKDFGLEAWHTEVIVADNVAQYYFDSKDKEWSNKEWSNKDFPVVSPAFELSWMEFARPQGKNYPSDWPSRFAFWAHAGEVPSESPWNEESGAFQLCKKVGFDCPVKPRWLMRMMLYVKIAGLLGHNGEECIGPCAVWMVALNERGEITHKDSSYIEVNVTKDKEETLLNCALLTLSLMNCKNVSLENNEPSRIASKQWRKRHGEPLAKFKTLNIEPMRKVLVSEGGQQQQGLKLAMHICRGHFRDYRERGVFGKHKGIYWWDSFVRGSSAEGVIYKSYEVKRPKEKTA